MSTEIVKAVRNKALRFLARREYAKTELHRRLIQAGFADDDDLAIVLENLIKENLLSDTRFIENYIHFRRQKGFGPLRIALELNEKGLYENEYSPFLQTHDVEWFNTARLAWKKRFKNKTPKDLATKAKQIRFLQSRGFTGEQIKSIFSNK